MPDTVDTIVIGAGVVGLAVARSLALAGREVMVLEQHTLIGSEISSRNSEVIHAGIYYPTDSLKAQLCVRGRRLLYAYCNDRGVPHKRCGKIIVATNAAQRTVLQSYQTQATTNGVIGDEALEWLDAPAVQDLEPEVAAVGALHSPTTGIIDSHSYMLALQGDLETAGGLVVLNTPVIDLQQRDGGIRVMTQDLELQAQLVINSTGLSAVSLASRLTQHLPKAHYSIGHYYTYSGKSPFSRLVYPVAEAGGLGVHVTLDMAGAVKFGPDVRWLDKIDYQFDDSKREAFCAAIRNYFPNLDPTKLQPGYTGIRPKISGPTEPAGDFRIDGPRQHSVPGLINLLGIESPGLTASLAIAEAVATLSERTC